MSKSNIPDAEIVPLYSTDKDEKKEDEGERTNWDNPIEFILAIIGYAVGLGNVWRFPYLCQKNGGGAFIIPYALALVLMGVPIFYMELAIGQRLRKGPLGVWNKIAPYFAGLGFSAVAVSFLVGVYYNMVVAWCLYYLFISFTDELPYSKCPIIEGTNQTVVECEKAGSTQYYWYREVLEATDDITTSGGLNWKLVGCLFLAWVLIYFITCKGVKSMGKAVYFTALFPYVVLIIFFVQGMTLKGHSDGIRKMFTPEWERLATAEVWLEACTQIFYSLGLAFGGLIAMASYNPIKNNIVRDAVMVSSINCGTSIFAGIVIFSILGYKANLKYDDCVALAQSQGLTAAGMNCSLETYLNDVAQGPGLTFIAFTEAITSMSVGPLWSILFFMMLLTLGIGSMIGTFESVRTTFVDLKLFPFRPEITNAILCLISFLVGLLFCQRSGEYWLQMFDSFTGTISLLGIALFEIIIIIYIYGLRQFTKDIEFMLGRNLMNMNYYWKVTWLFIAPALTGGIVLFSLYELFSQDIKYKPWSKSRAENYDEAYPLWGEFLCFFLIVASLIMIPIFALLRKFNIYKLKEDL